MRYLFNDCVLDTERHELRRAGELVRLRPKVFQLLAYLIANRNRVISKQELFEQLWPKRIVGDATLNSCIMALRRAVGDRGESQHTIKTLHGQGHRFVASVVEQPHPSPGDEPKRDPVESPTDHTPEKPVAAPALNDSHEQRVDVNVRGNALQPTPAVTPEKEYKQVTVLACAVANAKAHASRLGPEAMDQLMQAFFVLARRAMARYQGTVTEWLGDGFTALFGAPRALEDHARRAVLAARELEQWVSENEVINELRQAEHISIGTGLHTGAVLVGRLDTSPNQIYTAVGETTDLATRIRDLANPGTLLMSESTYRLVHTEVRAECRDAIDVEGMSTPMPVYAVQSIVQRRAGVPQRGERALSRFVGRERELAILHERLSHVEAGEGQVVSVAGEPGIGKSRLLYEFRRRLTDKPVTYLEGHCLSYGGATPYLPVLSLLRQVCEIAETDTPDAITTAVRRRLEAAGIASHEAAALLVDLLGVPADSEVLERLSAEIRRERTFDYLRQLIVPISQRETCVLAVEDLHWIDATSEEWLAELVDRLAGAPILVLTTYRPGYRPPWLERSWATQLALPRLTSKDSGQLVRSIPRTPQLSNDLAQDILAKAQGNPFFLEELTWAVRDQGKPLASPHIPDTVQAVLAARIDRLLAPDKQLLQTAAVIGTPLPLSLLGAVGDLSAEDLGSALARLQAAELLYELSAPERTYTFKHALTQEVAYRSLLTRTRQELHRKIAEVLEKRFPDTVSHQPELLAHHYTEAHLADRAIGYWQRAGRRAGERAAYVEAIGHFERALEIVKTLPGTGERTRQELALQIDLAASMRLIERYEDALAVLDQAEASASEHGLAEKLTKIRYQRAGIYFRSANIQGCLEQSELALEDARQTGSREDEARAFSMLGDAYYMRGRMTTAHDYYHQCIELSRQDGFRRIEVANLHMRGLTRYFQNDLKAALEDGFTAAEAAAKIGLHRAEMIARGMLGGILFEMGDSSAAREQFEQALALARETGARSYEPFSLVNLGKIVAAEGDRSTGLKLVEEAIATSREVGMKISGPRALGALALITDDAAIRARALAEGEEILGEGCISHHYFSFYRDAMQACLNAGEWDSVERYASALEQYTRSEPLPLSDFFIVRGRALAAHGAGKRDCATMEQLKRLRDEAERVGFRTALPALQCALESG